MKHRIHHRAAAIVLMALSASAIAAGRGDVPAVDDANAAITAALAAAAPAKLMVAEQFAKTGAWSIDAAAIGYRSPEGIPATIAVDHGTIAIAFAAPDALAGKTLRLVPTDGGGKGRVTWTCEAPGFPAGSLPAGCR